MFGLENPTFLAKSDNKSATCAYGGGEVAGLGLIPKFYHFFGGFPKGALTKKVHLRVCLRAKLSFASTKSMHVLIFSYSVLDKMCGSLSSLGEDP